MGSYLEYYNYSAPKGGDEVGDKDLIVWNFLEVVATTTYQPGVFVHGYILGFEFSEWAMFWRCSMHVTFILTYI